MTSGVRVLAVIVAAVFLVLGNTTGFHAGAKIAPTVIYPIEYHLFGATLVPSPYFLGLVDFRPRYTEPARPIEWRACRERRTAAQAPYGAPPTDRRAGKLLEAWRVDYNTGRPHSALGNQTPAASAAASVLAMQRGEALRYPRGFAPRPVAPPALMGSNDERTQAPTG